MDNLAELRRRKAELHAKMEEQKKEIKATVVELRKDFEPAALLKKAVTGALGFTGDPAKDNLPENKGKLPGMLSFLADIFIKDPKWAFVWKLLGPVAMRLLQRSGKQKTNPEPPGTDVQVYDGNQPPLPVELLQDEMLQEEAPPESPLKTKIYGQLRRGVSSLRNQLKKAEKETPETTTDQPDN